MTAAYRATTDTTDLRVRTPDASAVERACLHCGQPVTSGDTAAFCCFGCRTVHAALASAGLERFYSLRGARGEPVGDLELERRSYTWLSPLEQTLAAASADGATLRMRTQGIRCAACVWVIEQLFSRTPGARRVLVNPALGTLELAVERSFPLREFVDGIERCGYRLGLVSESQGARAGEQDTLLLRLGICCALALNAMMFSAAIYFGLEHGPLYELLHGLAYGAAVLSVLVGGPVFFGAARAALSRGVLHLDVPIALGIALTFAAATWSYFTGQRGTAYFDSLAAFVALMLAGRYLQERALSRNRRELLDDTGLENQLARRIDGDGVHSTRYRELRRDDVLLLSPGDLVPIDAVLLDAAASCSLDWISGEPEPRAFARDERIPAGAFNAGAHAVRVRLSSDYAGSALLPIVSRTRAGHGDGERLQGFSTTYVLAVLGLAAGALAYHASLGDPVTGLSVATAVCVVTCPCAIGIAVPLAYELVHAALRRRGLFVRDPSFLDRVRQVRRVVFDKTGTLTTGKLHVLDPQALAALPAAERQALYDLSVRSLHPMSIAVRRALEGQGVAFRSEVEARELPGEGIEAKIEGRLYRLGRESFVTGRSAAGGELVFGADGEVLARIATAEADRPDAAAEVAALRRLGYDVFVLSGDAPARVAATAARLGLPQERAVGGMSPADKADWLERAGADQTLMIGDGINDAAAVGVARCSGTPAIDRALLPARTDFYFTTAGLSPVTAALLASRDLSAVVSRTLGFGLAYNAFAVTLALAGAMQPWLAAVLMPLSSIATVAATASALEHRSRRWKC